MFSPYPVVGYVLDLSELIYAGNTFPDIVGDTLTRSWQGDTIPQVTVVHESLASVLPDCLAANRCQTREETLLRLEQRLSDGL